MDENKLGSKYSDLVNGLVERGVLKSKTLIGAFRKAPRYMFIPEEYIRLADIDIPLPIAGGSTISQPSTVAIMLEELAPERGDRVLEIGTGSGWETAILSFCVGPKGRVISVEIDKTICEFARNNISKLKIRNAKLVCADGSKGYGKEAPYDRIIFTAALPDVPNDAMKQLKVHGRLIAPVGAILQEMVVINRISRDEYAKREIGTFVFVPIKKGN